MTDGADNSTTSSTRIAIPYDIVEDHLHCSICLSVIRGAVLTPCGHRYCNKCITEWSGRNHSCPCCNSSLNVGQLYYDVQFDSLVEQILTARDEAEEAHFAKMFDKGSTVETEYGSSPFHEVFKKHIKASLISFEKYFQKLHDDHRRQMHILEAASHSGMSQNDKENQLAALKEKLELSEKLAVESFDNFMTRNIPSFEVLPVTVSVYISDKNIRIPNITIQPNDNLTSVKPAVENFMEQRLDPINNWSGDGEIFLVGPMDKCEDYKIVDLLNDRIPSSPLSWSSQPVFQHNLLPGSEIVLHAAFKSQSDMPKLCFVDTFQKGTNQIVDYFSCNNCNVKWICKSCSQACHAGHSVIPFTFNHKPNWACCYCPKKKLCQIKKGMQG